MQAAPSPSRRRSRGNWLTSTTLALALALAACSTSPQTTEPLAVQSSAARPASSDAPVAGSLPALPPDPREPVLAEVFAELFPTQHFTKRGLDDGLSKEAFAAYVERLDGAKLLLLEAHVAELAKSSDRIDDQLRARDLLLARQGALLLRERRKAMAAVVAELLAQPFDLTQKGEVETDADKLAYCKTEAELRERWKKTLTLQLLERIHQLEELRKPPKEAPKDAAAAAALKKLVDETPETPEGREKKAREELAARFASRFQRMSEAEALDPAEMLLNAVAAVYDPHTQYMPPADKANFDIAMTGKLQGIGAALAEKDHHVVVHELVPGGASWQQGKLEAGDVILSVAQAGASPVDVFDMPLDKVVGMIRGPKGTTVTLTVKKPDGRIEVISIVRDVITIEASYARGAVLQLGKGGASYGYVYLPSFYGDVGSGPSRPGDRNATADVRALLRVLDREKVSGIVLDLRGNGGGLLSHARDIGGLFVDQGPIVQSRDSKGRVEVLRDDDPSTAFGGPVVVLVDRFSASASEIVAGALQDYGRAIVVGTGATHGKGSVQAVIGLDELVNAPGGAPLGVLKLTTQQYFRVSGASTQVRGVVPDVLLPDPAAFVEGGERSLPHALPWSQVDALPFRKQGPKVDLAALAKASAERVQKEPVFARIEAFGKIAKARREKTVEPLDLETWRADKERTKKEIDAVDPDRKKLPQVLEVRLVEDPAHAIPKDPKLRKDIDGWRDELARDPWLAETLRVLGDVGSAK